MSTHTGICINPLLLIKNLYLHCYFRLSTYRRTFPYIWAMLLGPWAKKQQQNQPQATKQINIKVTFQFQPFPEQMQKIHISYAGVSCLSLKGSTIFQQASDNICLSGYCKILAVIKKPPTRYNLCQSWQNSSCPFRANNGGFEALVFALSSRYWMKSY